MNDGTTPEVLDEILAARPAETVVAEAADSGNGAVDMELQSAVEAIIYATEDPATVGQMAAATGATKSDVEKAIAALTARYRSDEFGIEIKPVAGGYRMATKPQNHEAVRKFIKNLKPPIRLSLPALETLAVIAYRQPVTAPEIKEIRGVDASGVLNTLLEKKLVTTAGRKEVIGKPILYKTTREFLVRFGLSSINDLPTLKEFEEMTRAGLEGVVLDSEPAGSAAGAEAVAESTGPAELSSDSGKNADTIVNEDADSIVNGDNEDSLAAETDESEGAAEAVNPSAEQAVPPELAAKVEADAPKQVQPASDPSGEETLQLDDERERVAS